jgi:hypothetical protein
MNAHFSLNRPTKLLQQHAPIPRLTKNECLLSPEPPYA